MDNFELLLADGIIDAVLGRLKSGKEADLWLVQHGGQVVAAKIYRDRDFRSFKNDAAYKEGRLVGNSRTARALARGSRFGRDAAEQAWKSAEADALHKLHAHGVRTPAPVLFYEGVLLMELVVDAQGEPAPRLIDCAPTAEAAGAMYRDLRSQAIKMLDADLIHGDLSPYNILLGAAGPTIIDFPQVIAAAHNSRSESFFERDLENVRRFLAGFDPGLEACSADAREIWRAYVRRELSPDFVPSGRPPAQPSVRGGGTRSAQQQQRPSRPAQQQRPSHPGQQQQRPSHPAPQQQQRHGQQHRHNGQQQRRPGAPQPQRGSAVHPPQQGPAPQPSRAANPTPPPPGPTVERIARLAAPTAEGSPERRPHGQHPAHPMPHPQQPSRPGSGSAQRRPQTWRR